MIKTVILDFDGTIGDTRRLIVSSMQETFARLGLPKLSDEKCASTIGLPLRQSFTRLLSINETKAAECEATYREIFSRKNANYTVPIFPHVLETIKFLNEKRLTVTIASSRSNYSLQKFIKELNLDDKIKYFVGANDVKQAKPAPDMVLKIMEKTGDSPQNIIVVGDTNYDIAMGHAAGTMTCGVTYGNGKPEDISDADFIINDIAKLAEIIMSINS